MPILTVYDSYVHLENFNLPSWVCFSFSDVGLYIGPKKDTLYYGDINVITTDGDVFSPDIVYECKKRGISMAPFIFYDGVYFMMS